MRAEQHRHTQHEETAAFMVNHLVANLGVLNVKLHQYHWHVQGPHFFTLHDKFEELYNEADTYFDELAERVLSIGETPYSTLGEFLEHASISEQTYDKSLSDRQMVENLVGDYRTIRDITTKAIEIADKEGDAVTEDLMTDYKGSIDKNIWMLQAYLGKGALEGED
ncbi:DNA starvation/stationary phase protection protein [Virgibacillus sp. YIM 98842]|uniref:Dps family protein n=1 Tax=Virgibacillus sp. YIM 98842 TaxID=2663533 RepID=UPI001969ABDF|nr:DNA starvation/stationary phase protection protein [Virgibacillus sp. YIM 98842]